MKKMKNINPRDLKEKYDFDCPYCGCELYAEPSLAMRSGMNLGVGSCNGCGKTYTLAINHDNITMTAERIDSEAEAGSDTRH